MFSLLAGTAILALFLVSLRAFERASVSSIHAFMYWAIALGGIVLTLGLVISGRGAQALAGLVLVGPLLWRQWRESRPGGAAGAKGGTGSPRASNAMTREEAFAVLGLKPGASVDDIVAAHRRLMRAAHPDAGGSDWLASRINQARDILVG